MKNENTNNVDENQSNWVDALAWTAERGLKFSYVLTTLVWTLASLYAIVTNYSGVVTLLSGVVVLVGGAVCLTVIHIAALAIVTFGEQRVKSIMEHRRAKREAKKSKRKFRLSLPKLLNPFTLLKKRGKKKVEEPVEVEVVNTNNFENVEVVEASSPAVPNPSEGEQMLRVSKAQLESSLLTLQQKLDQADRETKNLQTEISVLKASHKSEIAEIADENAAAISELEGEIDGLRALLEKAGAERANDAILGDQLPDARAYDKCLSIVGTLDGAELQFMVEKLDAIQHLPKVHLQSLREFADAATAEHFAKAGRPASASAVKSLVKNMQNRKKNAVNPQSQQLKKGGKKRPPHKPALRHNQPQRAEA